MPLLFPPPVTVSGVLLRMRLMWINKIGGWCWTQKQDQEFEFSLFCYGDIYGGLSLYAVACFCPYDGHKKGHNCFFVRLGCFFYYYYFVRL